MPFIYGMVCEGCGRRWDRLSSVEQRYAPCEACGSIPSQDLTPSQTYQPFKARFDEGLGEYVTSFADRWRFMRQKGLQYREFPSAGDRSARRDRIEQQKKEQARG